jgi:hypothetical protein
MVRTMLRATFLVLVFSSLLSFSAQAQSENSELFPLNENNARENSASGLPRHPKSIPVDTSEPLPLIPLSLALAVLLFASPFAVHYFSDMAKEMRAAQKGSSPRKTKV